MSQYSVTLWDSLKFEVLTPQEPELAQETCLILREITVCLSNSTQKSPTASPLAQYLRPIIKECNETLQEPAQRQAKGAGEILKAVSSVNALSFVSIIKSVVAPTLTLYQSADSSLKRRALLDFWNLLSEAGLEVWGSWKDHKLASDALTENPLLQFKENFLDLYGEAMMSTSTQEVSFRISAAKGLLHLSKIRNFLDESEIGLVVRHFNTIILDENMYDHDELRSNAMRGLSEISSFQPRLIMDVSFPAFIARLPENETDAATSKNYSVVLEGLFEISAEKEVSGTLIRRLLNKIDILFRDSSGTIEYTFATLATIHRALARRPDNLDIYYDRIVVGLVRTAAEALKSKVSSPLMHERILDLLGRTANIIIAQSTLDKKTEACKNVYLLYSDLGIDTLTKSHADDEIQKMLVISTWLLAALPRDFPGLVFDIESVCKVTQKLVNFLIRAKCIPSVEGACLRQVALYVNKHFGKSEFPLVTELMSHFYKSVSAASSTGDYDHSSLINVKLIFILTKALVLRLALNTNQLLSDLTSLLDPQNHPLHVTTMAASSFSMLLSKDEVLSKSNYFEIRLLSTQRVFHTLTPILSSKFKDTSDPIEKENCLTALSGIISTVPSELVMPEITALLPLLLQSLDLSNQGVKIATLETLAVVIVNSPSTLEESGHVPTLVKRLLLVANTQKGKTDKMDTTNLPRTRALAIRCLRMMPGHITGGGSRSDPLLALKAEVLQKLVKILDDPKRDIRKEAVDARAAWIRGVDDVKEDEEDD
jgi:DNA repair/transcription protein MET18/MMS19